MSIVQIAAKLGDDHRFVRRDLCETWIGLTHFELEAYRAFTSCRRGRAVGAERDPIAIIFARKIIFEPVPAFFRLIEPVDVPDPLQIIRAFRAHKVDYVPISSDVTRRALDCATIPFSVPAEPIPVWFSPPLDQNGRAEVLRVMRPGAKVDIEVAGNDFLQAELLFRVPLIDIGAKHQAYVRNFT